MPCKFVGGILKYLVYVRVSTDKQDVEMQETAIFNYLKARHPDNKFKYELFSDPETSSGLPMAKRLGLTRMLENITKGTLVITYALDRLSRDIIEAVLIWRQVQKVGSDIYSTTEGFFDEFKLNIMASVAQKVRTDIRRKTKDGLKNKKQRNERYSRYLPYGYKMHETHLVPIRVGRDIVYKPGVLVPVEEEQKILSLMLEYFQAGLSYHQIAKALTLLGYMNREGKPFQKMSIYRILLKRGHSRSDDQLLEGKELALSHSK